MKEILLQLKVVIIGNEKDCQRIIIEAMKKAGLKPSVRMIKNGTFVKRWLNNVEELPNVIFADIDSEKQTSCSALKLIRENPRFKNIPVIVLSDSTYIEQIKTTFDYGANLYLPKPVFSVCRSKALETIFAPDWKERLLNRNKNTFVINHTLSKGSKPGLHAY